MKVEEFIKEYLENKDSLSKHIVTTYVPYATKIALSKNNVAISLYKDGVYCLNSPIQYMLWVRMVIESYTDIRFSEDVQKEFDLLEENNIMAEIIPFIESDYNRFLKVFQLTVNDTIDRENNLISFLETKIEALEKAFDVMETALTEVGDKIERTN